MRRLLLTAFEPFGKSTSNASEVAARHISERGLPDTIVETLILPVVRGTAEQKLLAHLDRQPAPDVIVSLGEAGWEPKVIRLEKVALNWDDFRIPDNGGNQPRDSVILPNGPAAYSATLPVAEIAQQLEGKTALPVVVSLSAGAFLCNHLAYVMLNHFAENPDAACPYLFIHLPAWRPKHGEETQGEIALTLRTALVAALSLT